ncbi:MAG: CHC2 zinc finger domain-containing protein [Patescibacteria group bacterium]
MPDVDNFSPSELVKTFPQGKTIVKRLLKEQEALLQKIDDYESEVRGNLSSKVTMFDLDLAVKLVMTTCANVREKAQEHVWWLKRMLYLYEPKKKSVGGITDMDIQNARYVRISTLLVVKRSNALCPFHDDHKPSMKVYPDNHAYCFVCNKWADSIDLVMQLRGLDFVGAVKLLNNA